MASALPGSGRLLGPNAEVRQLHRIVHGLSLPQRNRLPEFNQHSIVARSGAAGAIPALIPPLEPTSLPLITTAKLYLTIFGAGLLAYVLSRSQDEVRIFDIIATAPPALCPPTPPMFVSTQTEIIGDGLISAVICSSCGVRVVL